MDRRFTSTVLVLAFLFFAWSILSSIANERVCKERDAKKEKK